MASGAIGTVNPFVLATVQRSTGAMTNPDGSRTPTYETFGISCQVQSLTYSDIMYLDSLNVQGVRRTVYLTGNVMAIVRVDRRGGDLLVFADGVLVEGNTWLAAQVIEAWPDWCRVCITLQNGS